jgi:hypothetical protein
MRSNISETTVGSLGRARTTRLQVGALGVGGGVLGRHLVELPDQELPGILVGQPGDQLAHLVLGQVLGQIDGGCRFRLARHARHHLPRRAHRQPQPHDEREPQKQAAA